MRAYLAAPILAMALAVAATAPASAIDDYFKFGRLNVPANQWLSPSQIADKLAEQGYKVRKIESDDGAYEVDMVDKNGVLIETHVHPATGELLPSYDD